MNKNIIFGLLLAISCGSNNAEILQITDTQTIEKIIYQEPPQNEIGDIVYDENKYRESIGQLPLSEGLSCTLYTVPNSTTQITGATLTTIGSFIYKGLFNIENGSVNNGLSILPQGLKQIHKTYYILRCSGQLVITEDGYHNFDLTSDDGSMLYLGGALLINHDGLHGVSTKSAVKYIRRGITAFRVDYLQSNGNQALTIKMNNEIIKSELFWR